MNLGTYDATIDFSKLFVHNSTSIYFKEGDLNTAKVRAKLTMQGKSIDITGCNIVVKIETMAGQKIDDVATIIDATNGIVEIDFKSNTLIEGTNFFELKIIKGESVKKSPKLAYRVLDSIEDAGSIEATNEYPILISLISDANKAIQDAEEALDITKDMEVNINEAIENAYRSANYADIATSNANTKIEEVETTRTEMIEKVDTSIATMKSDVETAKNEMASKADEKIADIDRALASGTVDLELKEARKDANGVVHDTVKQRLDSDFGKLEFKSMINFLGKNHINFLGFNSINIIGDSISHGANACEIVDDSWVGIFRKSIQSEFNKNNYGFVNTYGKLSNSIGSFNDLFDVWAHSDVVKFTSDKYLGFYAHRNSVPKKYSTFTFRRSMYIKKIGIAFDVIEESNSCDIVLKDSDNTFKTVSINFKDLGLGQKISWVDTSEMNTLTYIQVVNKLGTTITTGIYIIDNLNDIVVNNYSRSGARIQDCSDYIIDKMFDTNLLIFALGHNSSSNVDTYLYKIKNKYTSLEFKPKVLVLDFLWTNNRKSDSDKLKDLAKYMNGEYIEIIDKVDDAQSLIDNGFLSDFSHPSLYGHQIIASKVLNSIGANFVSKGIISKSMNTIESTELLSKLMNGYVIRYSGGFDENDANYHYFKDIKLRLEIKPTGSFIPQEVYFSKDQSSNLRIYYGKDSPSAWSENLPFKKGVSKFTNASWESDKPFEGIIDIKNEDIRIALADVPDGTKIKLKGVVVPEITTEKISLIDIIRYI